ncbi:MAG TPA: ATP-binding protein [Malonomonas sp.]
MSAAIKPVSLTRKLLLSTLLVCLLISLVVSLFEIHSRQDWQKQQIRNSFKGFIAGPLLEVGESLWNYNWKMLQTIADSQTSQLFTFMEICDTEGKECVRQGARAATTFLDFHANVNYPFPRMSGQLTIGQVYAQAAYQDYLTLLILEFPLIFLVNSLGIFSLAAIMFLLFHLLAGRRLMAVEKYTREIDLAHVEQLQPLAALKRTAHPDEIDLLADAVDGLVERVKSEFERRQQLEQQLTQSQKMEALGTLAGGIAHDFNNILAAILGYAQLCQIGVDPESKLQSRLLQIVHAGERAKALIAQILIFSRHTEATQEKIQLSAVVSEALSLIRASLPETVQIETALDENLWVMGDATQLHQVVMNLASNAGYALAEQGGTLRVSISQQQVAGGQSCTLTLDPGSDVCLQIEDDGPGIPPELHDRIFEPFFTTKKADKGTGMGLAVVHGIVQSHKGTICLESGEGEGTRFRIYLPQEPPAEELPTAASADVCGGQERLLLVDDEPGVLDTGKDLLQDLGYQVSVCRNPLQALELLLAEHDFDLLISDLTMPEMSGTDLAKEIWAQNPTLPVMIWTGFADQAGEGALRVAGVRHILHKPFTVAELDGAIRTVLKAALPPAARQSGV